MSDPEFQAIWHELNQAQVSLVLAHGETSVARCRQLLADAQDRAKLADVKLKQLLSKRGG